MARIIDTIDINLYGTEYKGVEIQLANYQQGGGTAIQLWHEGSPFGTLTTNLPDAKLEEGEFCVKTWSENELVWPACFATGKFVDTGKRVPAGWVEAQVWKFA